MYQSECGEQLIRLYVVVSRDGQELTIFHCKILTYAQNNRFELGLVQ